MDKQKRKELIEQFKQIKVYMGIYVIRNDVNERIFIGSAPNLKNKWVTLKLQLEDGRHANKLLQNDWNEFGGDVFHYEILEQKDTTDIVDRKWELKQMIKKWMNKLQPYNEKGYHNSNAVN